MKGLVVEQIGRLTLKDDLPVPQIGEYEALVKIETCMICNGTDLGVIHGKVREVPQYPVVLGHEDAGYVVKTGSRVRSFRIGDLVLRAGQPDGGPYASAWGGFAEYGVVYDYAAMQQDGVHSASQFLGITQQICPPQMQPEDASMLITLKETYSALVRLHAAGASSMVLIGDGPVALSLRVCGQLLGIRELSVFGNHPEKLRVAELLGAAGTFRSASETDRARALQKLGGRIDVCVDTIGSNETVAQCFPLIHEAGIIGIYGLKSGPEIRFAAPELRNFTFQFIQWPLPQAEADCHDVVAAAVMDGRIDTKKLITHRFAIDEYEKGFAAVEDRTALKVVLQF